MPYVHDVGFVLSPAQEALRLALIAAAQPLRALGYHARAEPYPLGTLVIPAHTPEGGTIAVPERRHRVVFVRSWGITCPSLGTDNGSPWQIAAQVPDITRWEPIDNPGQGA